MLYATQAVYTLLLVLSILQMHTTENTHEIVEQDHIDV